MSPRMRVRLRADFALQSEHPSGRNGIFVTRANDETLPFLISSRPPAALLLRANAGPQAVDPVTLVSSRVELL